MKENARYRLCSTLRPLSRKRPRRQETALMATDYAQAGIGVISAGMFTLLAKAGFQPSFTAGHSFGELTALWAGGVLSDEDFLLVKARGKAMRPPARSESDIEDESTGTGPQEGFDAGTMAAVQGLREGVEDIVRAFDGVVVANDNSNSQVVIAGPTDAVRAASEALNAKGYRATLLPVSAVFHHRSGQPCLEAILRGLWPVPSFTKPGPRLFEHHGSAIP